MTRFVQPEKIEIDANERAVNEKSQYCFFVCTTFDSFLNDFTKECDCMKITKIILSIITMLFAVLGLVKILPFDIANPIMLVSLATLLLLRSVEYKNNRDKGGFIMTCLTAVFVYVVVIYNVFIG